MNSPKLSYRAQIDGLRAIAVVSVILYHAQMTLFGSNWFEGGFIGVDIFFVISGYLITRIIFSELQTKGSFSFLNFYERRARRILPMLFVVILVSVPYAWRKLLPLDFVEYAESILTSIFFGSNFFFYFSTTWYGSDSALLKPFLHTWSLGVEEQFYLVFPILAILSFKFFRAYFLTTLVALSLLSLLFAEVMGARNSDFNFYLPFGRFWELAAGSMLAYRELNYKPSGESLGKRVLPILGLCLLVYSILFFDGKTPHPSFYTLIPIIGVALIIGYSSKDELVGKLLGSKPFVWVGLISYSAYLWHFPIFAFSRMGKEPTNHDKVEWLFLTLLLSVFSYFLIEKPFRNKKLIGGKLFVTIVLIVPTLIVIGAYNVIVSNGFSSRLPPILQSDLKETPWLFNKSEDDKYCYGWYEKTDFCSFGLKNSAKNIYVIGDSNMEPISNAVVANFTPQGFQVTTMNSSACYFIPNSYSSRHGKRREIVNEPCDESFQESRLAKLGSTENNVIIVGGMLDVYLDKTMFESVNEQSASENFIETIESLVSEGTKVILVYPYPLPGRNMGKYAFDKLGDVKASSIPILKKKIYNMIDETSYPFLDFEIYAKDSFELLDSLQSHNIARVYPHKLFCKNKRCQFLDDKGLFIVDSNHPSGYMAEKVVDLIRSEIEMNGW